MPRSKDGEIQRCAPHLSPVNTYEPRARLAVAQEQSVFSVVRGIAHPPVAAGFTLAWLIAAVEGDAQDRRLLGSVSTGLVHHAHCPVAVIHDEARSLQDDHRPVLVGIDGSRASELATTIAFDEASSRGVELVALHVWSDADVSTAVGSRKDRHILTFGPWE